MPEAREVVGAAPGGEEEYVANIASSLSPLTPLPSLWIDESIIGRMITDDESMLAAANNHQLVARRSDRPLRELGIGLGTAAKPSKAVGARE